MSYPNPPSSGRSPWFYVGMGCLVLFGLGFVGCVAIGITGYNYLKPRMEAVRKAMDTPVTEAEVKAGLKDTPIYPNAVFVDTRETRAMRATMRMLKEGRLFKDVEVAAYKTAAPSDKVLAWYDQKMPALGYTVSKGKDADDEEASQSRAYRKGAAVVAVRYRSSDDESKDMKPVSRFILMRFEGVSENFSVDKVQKRGMRPGGADGD